MLDLARNAFPEPLALAIEIALTTGMRLGEVCALRWSDLHDDGTISVNRALGKAQGGFYEKDPKTFTSARTIPLTRYTFRMLSVVKEDAYRLLARLGVPQADPYILGHAGARLPPIQPDTARQGLHGVLQDERLSLHVPRPSPHLRDFHDRRGRRRAHRCEPPRP